MSYEEDWMELDSIEIENCIKCSGDGGTGNLLVCSVTGCPIAVHEECMSIKPEIDKNGKFYCPYCAHKRAVVRAEKLRRKALGAKEVLSKFIDSCRGSGERSSSNGGEEGRGEGVGAVREETDKGDSEQQCMSERCEVDNRNEEDVVGGIDRRDGHGRGNEEDEMQQEAMEVPLLRKRRYKQRAQKIVQDQREKDTSSESRKVSGSDRSEKGTASNNSRDIPESNQNEKAASSSKKSRTSPELNQNKEVPESNLTEKATTPLSSESREIPDLNQIEKATTIFSKSRKEPDLNQNRDSTTSSAEPIKIPQYESVVSLYRAKRKKIPWTAEELEMLKDGIRQYLGQVNKNLPWRKILEYGKDVFHESRNPDSLKDKWKLLRKEESNRNQI